MRARPPHERYASLSWLIVTMTVVALVIGAVALRYIENRLVASKGESLALAAAEIAHKLDLLLAERHGDIRAFAQTPLFHGSDDAAKNAYLDSLRTIYPLYLFLGVTDAQGRFVAATDRVGIGMDVSRSHWFQAVRDTGTVHVGDVEPFAEAGGVDAISFTAPIQGAGGEFQGAVTMRVGLPLLEDMVARTIRTVQAGEKSGEHLEYRFLKNRGEVFIDSDLFHKGNVNLKQMKLSSALLSESGQPGYFEEEHLQRHVPVVTGYARTQGSGEFHGLRWTVLLRGDKDTLVAPIRSMLWKLAGAWVLVWLPMLGFSLWSARRLKKEWAHALIEQAHAETTELKYRQLVEQAGDIIYRTDSNGYFTYVNSTVTRVKGYTPEELIGRHFTEHIRADARDAAKRFYVRQFARKTPTTYYEFPATRKDGREIWLGQNVELLIENGQVVGFQAVARDITDRKRAEEALTASEMQMRLFMEATADCIWSWDLVGNRVARSVRFQRLFGYAAEEIVPTIDWWADRLHPDDRERVWTIFEDAVASGRTTCSYEYRFCRRDGSFAIIDDRAFIVRDVTGKVVRALGAMTDITARKRAEEALRTTTEFLQALVQTSPLAIINLDSNGNVTSWNRAAEEMLGWSESEVLGKPLPYIPVEKQAESDRLWDEAKRSSGLRGIEIRRVRKDGTSVDLELWSRTFRNEQGMPTLLVGILADITERKRAEEALVASEKRLRTILEAEPECVKVTTEDGLLLDMNPAGLAMIEADSLEQVRNQSVCPLIAPAHRGTFAEFNRRVYRGEPGTLQFEIVGLKGTRRWMDTHAVPLRNEQGETVGVLAITRDITERKREDEIRRQLNEELAESRSRFEAIFRQTPSAITITTVREGRILDVNKKAEDLTGYSRDELIGRTTTEMNLYIHVGGGSGAMEELMKGVQLFDVERLIRTKSGEVRIAVFGLAPIQIGSEPCLLSIAHDITERKREEKTLHMLLEGMASATGEQFFPALVRSLSRELEVRYALVTELLGDERPRLRTLAIWMGNRLGSPTEYDLSSTPCENVIKQGAAYYSDAVQKRFPYDKNLATLGAVSYLGVALKDGSGRTIGHLCILDDKPLPGEHRIASLLKVFASRAAAELDRKRVEEDQKRLLAELAESRNRFEMFFRETPSAISITTVSEGRFLDVNKQAEILTGYSQEELLGRTTLEMNLYVDPTDRDKIVQQLKKTGTLTNLERQIRTKSGEIRTAIFSLVPIQMGDEPCLLSIAHDITERKRMEEKLLLSQEIIANANDPISIMDLQGRFIYQNASHASLIGFPDEELLGKTPALFLGEKAFASICQELTNTRNYRGEVIARTKDGASKDLALSVFPIVDAADRPTCFVAIKRDITERKRIEEGLRERSRQQAIEAELSLLVATVQDQSSLLNTAVRLVANALDVDYCEALELLPNNSELRLCASAGWKGDRIGQVRAAEAGSLAHAALQSGKPVVQTLPDNRQFGGPPWLHKHGTVAGMSVSVPCKDRSWGVLGVYRAGGRAFSRDDINFLQTVASTLATAIERMQAERVLTSANQALRLLSQQLLQVQENERRTIARDLHDEIGQSLTAIKLNVERAQRVSEPAAKTRIMQDCAQIAERVLAQVRNLSLDLHPSILDDLGLPYALKWYAGRLAEQAGLKVEVEADTSLPRLSQDIEIACFRIAQEALTNVVRHARASQVGIVLKRGAAAVELCVQDDGIGFVPDNIASPTNGETSVGLASMQERAKLLGGTVKIASAPRCGTKVIATLPLLVASPADVPIEEVPRS